MFIKCKSIFSETFKLNLQNGDDPARLDYVAVAQAERG